VTPIGVDRIFISELQPDGTLERVAAREEDDARPVPRQGPYFGIMCAVTTGLRLAAAGFQRRQWGGLSTEELARLAAAGGAPAFR